MGRFRVFYGFDENTLDNELNKITSPAQMAYINVFNGFIIGMRNNYENKIYGTQLKSSYSLGQVLYRNRNGVSWSTWVVIN